MNSLARTIPALALTVSVLAAPALLSAPANAQAAHMAQAAHKGTFNYLRDAPSRHSHILEKMPQGTRFQVVGLNGDYYAVVLATGQHGWTFKTNARME